jgi:hypothetical protein
MAWANALWKRYAAKWANKRPAGTKPMLDILRLPMTKETLSKMTPEERSLFLLLGYASNQVNALWKLVIITTNSTPDDPIERRVWRTDTDFRQADHRGNAGSVDVDRKGIPKKQDRKGIRAPA